MQEDESLRRAIHEPVQLQPYDPSWPQLFDREKARLLAICPTSFPGIEHIGSTAVPSLTGKPVIDIMAGVQSLEQADAVVPVLCGNGYVTSPEFNTTLENRRWLMRHAEGRRTHHLHLLIFEAREWREMLMFREILRANAELRCRYENLKLRLAKESGADREAYTAMKTDFIRNTLEEIGP